MSGTGYGIFCGLDVGKSSHHAVALDPGGARLHDAELPQDEQRLRQLFGDLQAHGPVLVVVDQPATIGALPDAVAREAGCQVAYLPGLAMRRIADLHPGSAKTDTATLTSLPRPPAPCRTRCAGSTPARRCSPSSAC